MVLEWMGEYRGFVEQLIRYCNLYAAVYKQEIPYGQASFSFSQIQVVEYLLENQERNQNMTEIATRLGISFSTFSKLVNKLEKKGFIEKYHTADNRKNVVVKVSAEGEKLYAAYAKAIYDTHFSYMFDAMKNVPKEELNTIARAMNDAWELPKKQKAAQKEAPVLIPCK